MSAIFGSSAKAGTPAAPAENSRGQAGHRVAVKLAVRDQRAVRGTCRRYCRDCRPAVLDVLAKKNKQKLNWRPSIVDLTKLLDLDSNQAARKKLADELHYSGDTRTPPDECLAAQAGDDQTCRQWREGPEGIEALGDLHVRADAKCG